MIIEIRKVYNEEVYRNNKGEIEKINSKLFKRVTWYKWMGDRYAYHRKDGPALMYFSGWTAYWIYGNSLKKAIFNNWVLRIACLLHRVNAVNS